MTPLLRTFQQSRDLVLQHYRGTGSELIQKMVELHCWGVELDQRMIELNNLAEMLLEPDRPIDEPLNEVYPQLSGNVVISSSLDVRAIRRPIDEPAGQLIKQGYGMDLKQYLSIVWRWAWLIVLCAIIAGSTAFGVSMRMVAVYQASTTLMVDQSTSISSASQNYDALLASQLLAKSYADLLVKQPVLTSVIANLKLDTTPQNLATRISVNSTANTQYIVLIAEDSDPQRAAEIANEIVRVFVASIREQQQARFTDAKQNITDEMAQLQQEIEHTQADLDTLQSPITSEQADRKRQLEVLNSQYRNNYTALLNTFTTLQLSEPSMTDSVKVIEVAHPGTAPVWPRTLLNVLIAAIVAGLMAVGAAFLIELLDDSVRSAKDVHERVGLPTLGAIGNFKSSSPSKRLVTVTDPSNSVAEGYRSLRTNIDIFTDEFPARTLVVTSGSPGEGKSTVVANLAVAMAQGGKRVIVVDANLRNPTLHSFFNQPNERGLTTVLLRQDRNPISNYLVTTSVNNLQLLPSGPLPDHVGDLIIPNRITPLIESLKRESDVVLFDAPPLQVAVDALLLARQCDATLIVARAASTHIESLIGIKNWLIESRVNVLGVVLNRVKMRRFAYYNEPPPLQTYRQEKQNSSSRLFSKRGNGSPEESIEAGIELQSSVRSMIGK